MWTESKLSLQPSCLPFATAGHHNWWPSDEQASDDHASDDQASDDQASDEQASDEQASDDGRVRVEQKIFEGSHLTILITVQDIYTSVTIDMSRNKTLTR